jgi:phage gp36-like protein
MSYCTQQNLTDEFTEAELIQLTDAAGLGVINTVVVDRAIARADREINRYLSGRNDLPLAGDDVVDLACDIARYHLYVNGVPDHVKKRYDDAIKALAAMAKRELGVVDTTGTGATESGSIAEMVSSPSVFSRHSI